MNHQRRCSLLAVGLLALAVAATAQPARADFITTQLTGVYEGINPTSGFQEPEFTLTKGSVITPDILLGATVNDMLVNVLSAPVLDLNPSSPEFIIFGAKPTEKAVFAISNPGFLTANAGGIGQIYAGVSLTSNTLPGVDLSFFSLGGDLEIDYAGIVIVPKINPPGSATWAGGVTATFTLTAVPEPGSLTLVLGGLVTLAAAGWRKRLRQRR
jgi:hypothetical protein